MRVLPFVVLAVAALTAYSGIFRDPTVLWYRLSTSAMALYALMTLPQEHVDSFIRSYALFEQDVMTGGAEERANTVGYYQVVNHLCAVGDVEKMYIPPVMNPDLGVFGNQMAWEEKGLADKLDIQPNSTVLDMGCGRGRVAHHIASYTGAKVFGLNIDPSQIKMAEDYARVTGLLGTQLEFVNSNFNDPFPFPDETFDALYQVQVMTYAQDLVKLCTEMYRVLKPGAKLSFLDWVHLDAYDPNNPYHRQLLPKVKAVIGAVTTPHPKNFTEALEKSGFRVIMSEDASLGGHQARLIMNAKYFFEPLGAVLTFLAKIHVIPGHISTLFDRLTKHGEAFVEADELGLFTTSWQIIAQKPSSR